MNITITLGWWLIPAAITAATIGYAFWPERQDYHGYDLVGVARLLVGIIVSLAAWLIWSLLA